jgi:hypothetical protein
MNVQTQKSNTLYDSFDFYVVIKQVYRHGRLIHSILSIVRGSGIHKLIKLPFKIDVQLSHKTVQYTYNKYPNSILTIYRTKVPLNV